MSCSAFEACTKSVVRPLMTTDMITSTVSISIRV
jgi:hypothetical protein